jgi:parallel beta-helix repeat protein
MKRRILLAMAVSAGLAGCGQQPAGSAADTGYQKVLLEKLLDAKPGDVIEIPAGRFAFDRGLSLRTDGVTIRGAGSGKTILSFKGQVAGAEGLLVNSSNFTLEHLAIEDTKGDGLKVNEGDNITIRDVRVEWTRGPDTENGAYGIYPVRTRNVLIEDSTSIGASDAGIYVGQSHNVVVRRNHAERNVAGIEIENTIDADVYDNTATQNTGGILVFNMPNLTQPGHSTRVHANKVFANNTGNFARRGAAVASVPAGSGVVINSNDLVEIFDNDIADNKTANVIVSSYYSTGYMTKSGVAPTFDPYPEQIFIHDNRFSGGGDSPDGLDLKTLKVAMFGLGGRLPDVLWDGYVNASRKEGPQVCVDNGKAETLNADGPEKYKNPRLVTDQVRCRLPALPAVQLAPVTPVNTKAAPAA